MKKLVAGGTAVMLMLSGYLTSCKSTPSESSSKSKTTAESTLEERNKKSRSKGGDDSDAVISEEQAKPEKAEESETVEKPVVEETFRPVKDNDTESAVAKTDTQPVEAVSNTPAVPEKTPDAGSKKAEKKESETKITTAERKEGSGVISSTAVVSEEDDVYNPPNSEENFPETMKRINPSAKPNTAANLQDGSDGNDVNAGRAPVSSSPNTAANLQDGTNGKNNASSGSGSNQPRVASNGSGNTGNSNANASGMNAGGTGNGNKNGANGTGSGNTNNANGSANASSMNAGGKNGNAANGGTGAGNNASGMNASGSGANGSNTAGNGKNGNASGKNAGGINAGGSGNKNGANGTGSGNTNNANGSANGNNGSGNQMVADNLDKYRTWYSPAMNDIQRCGYFYTTPEICKFTMIEGAFKKISGYNKSAYGFVFGYSEPNGRMLKDYIRFEINVDGEYALYTWDGKNYTDLVEKNDKGTAYFYKHSAIQKGYNAQNKIKIVNNGNTFSVYVNNTLVQGNIPALKNGTKGVMAFFSVGKPDQEDLPATPVNVSMKITDAQRAN